MAKKSEAAATETKDVVAVPFSEVITGTLTLESVEVDDKGVPVETKVLTIAKGKQGDAVRYQATFNGVSGKVAATIAAAINDLLTSGLKVLPAAWAVPKNEKGVTFPEKGDNKPKEPESVDDLSPEMVEGMRANMADLSADVAAYREAENRTRQVVRKVAERVRDLRVQYSKAEFGIFVKLADATSDVAKLLTAKNTLGEFVFFANIPESLLALMPEGKASPKAAQAWINGLRGTVAHVIVDVVKANADLAGMTASEAVWVVVAEHVEGENVLAFDDVAATELFALHFRNWPGEGVALFDASADGKLLPARDDGKHVTASLFGSEGADELVKALCGAFNGYVSAADKAEMAEAKAKTKPLAARDFNSLSPDQVALHLFNILAGRVDETSDESLETTVGDCLAVVDKLGGWFDAVAAGTMTVADVLASGDKPTSEDDAEGDADAAS